MATKFALQPGLVFTSGRRNSAASVEGKHRVMLATFTTAAADGAVGTILGAIGDVIILGRLPNGSRLMPGSQILVSATLGAAATLAIGTYTKAANADVFTAVSAARYRAAAVVTADAAFANTLALNLFDEQTQEVWVGAVVAAAPLANGVSVAVYMPYVSD